MIKHIVSVMLIFKMLKRTCVNYINQDAQQKGDKYQYVFICKN